jgi:uncharacterized protein (DUF849 family)
VTEKVILNVALTGMVPTKRENPALPETAEEIAEDCARVRDLGASIVHVHAREGGLPTQKREVYADILRAVRARCPDLILCASCSGRNVPELEARAAVLDLEGDAKPDMASLTLGSLNFPRQASVNAPETIAGLAERMYARGIRPELEVFEVGMADLSRYLLRKGVLRPPLYFNLLLGSLGTISLSPLNLGTLLAALPEGAVWAAAGIGRFQLAANVMALAAGGHVRVGLEDNLHFDAARRDPATNPRLVERIAAIARSLGREPASPAETRGILGLPSR